MASMEEPAQRKRKLEITPTPPPTIIGDFMVVNGRYVKVEKPPVDESEWSSDDEVDPALEKEYYRQIHESGGFDLNIRIPTDNYLPFDLTNEEDLHDEIGICARVGLHWFNFQKGSNIELVSLVKYVSCLRGLVAYYITMDAMDPSDGSHFSFQTCVVRSAPLQNGDIRIMTEVCRINPKPDGVAKDNWIWNEQVVDGIRNGQQLDWLPDDALTQSGKQYCEVQESDIEENDWLDLYAEFAFQAVIEGGRTSFLDAVPLKINKLVVHTPEENVEPCKKLRSENATFYINFSDTGEIEHHRAVVSRFTDGIPGHVSLEVKPVWDSSSSSSSAPLSQ